MADRKKQSAADLHKWRFFRSGGFDQVRLETGADLKALGQLDPKLWAALSCPTSGLEFDTKTLELIDSDTDGHVRVPEVVAAVEWAASVLKNPDDLTAGAQALPLAAIDDSTPEGAELLASARQILANLGKDRSEVVTIEDTADTAKIFASTRFNGDGVVPAVAAEDPAAQAVIEDIIACVGAEEDRGGAPGISQEKIEQFFTEAQAYSDWWLAAEGDAANILPFGEETEAAVAVFEAVKAKVDDYFTRCRLAAFDSRAAEPLNPTPEEYAALASKNLSPATEEVAALPLAKIEAGKPLPLEKGLSPAWTAPIAVFRTKVVQPLLGGKTSLDADEWAALCVMFAAHETWQGNKKGATVEGLGIKRVRAILADGYKEMLTALVEKDKALAGAANAIASVDKLVRYHRDLFRLLNNFVSLRDFYTPGPKAIFQAGTLYLDGRSCELCLRIDDVGKHSGLANLSGTYLAYCDCQRRGGAEKMTIVAAFTNGDTDNLMVGRNGVFFDRRGQDWDATIVKIVEHPISVRQAFWYPYKRVGKMIGEQIEKMATAREKAVHDQAAAGVAEGAQKAEAGKTPAAPFDVGKFAGIFAAIGLAVGAIGTAIASVVTGLLGLKAWQMPLTIVGLILLVSGPSVIIAYLKLRKRNLAPLLDANGWAINTRAIINIPFGTSLTQVAALPPGAQRSFTDPYAEKKRPWKFYLFLLALIGGVAFLWHKGYIQEWRERFTAKETSAAVEGAAKPAAPAAPAPTAPASTATPAPTAPGK
ncbi:MAG: hypothetical protein P9F19_00930 [Candidatus Contendobacter sp.]|nr:hypothetical protein [Candidatus Contendobacter sp.]MDG4555952.1 hypothetical protein [Candidatus Contendobacter sp.]